MREVVVTVLHEEVGFVTQVVYDPDAEKDPAWLPQKLVEGCGGVDPYSDDYYDVIEMTHILKE